MAEARLEVGPLRPNRVLGERWLFFRQAALAVAEARDKVGMKMKALIAIAILLVIAWVVLRIALAITSGLLHLLWIVALVMLVMWVWDKVRPRP